MTIREVLNAGSANFAHDAIDIDDLEDIKFRDDYLIGLSTVYDEQERNDEHRRWAECQ